MKSLKGGKVFPSLKEKNEYKGDQLEICLAVLWPWRAGYKMQTTSAFAELVTKFAQG